MKKAFFKIHPLLVAIFPILALRNHNIIYVDLGSISRSLLLALLLAGIIWAVLTVVLKNSDKAGLITSMVMILFFSYGQIYLQFQTAFGFELRHRYLVLIFGTVLIGLSVLIRKLRNAAVLQQVLTVTGAVMVVFAVAQSAAYDINKFFVDAQARNQSKKQFTQLLSTIRRHPNCQTFI